MQRVVNQSQNTPNRREAVNYITWENNSNINFISGIKDMRIFLGQIIKPILCSIRKEKIVDVTFLINEFRTHKAYGYKISKDSLFTIILFD